MLMVVLGATSTCRRPSTARHRCEQTNSRHSLARCECIERGCCGSLRVLWLIAERLKSCGCGQLTLHQETRVPKLPCISLFVDVISFHSFYTSSSEKPMVGFPPNLIGLSHPTRIGMAFWFAPISVTSRHSTQSSPIPQIWPGTHGRMLELHFTT
jgi:hypothetical protein